MRGSYVENGRKKPVIGDMTKIRFVPNLSTAARRLLMNIEHTSRRLPGTQEARRSMRFDLYAMRVKYGVPIFVTFSPDEAHNLVMLRLSRVRRKDPVQLHECRDVRELSNLEEPSLELDFCIKLPMETLLATVPNHETRVRVLARDPLASVDGFRILVLLTIRHLFGMRVCPFCPDCNHGDRSTPCQDVFGSNATSVGGCFGRFDAAFTAIEAQKSTGSLHAHCQLFLQCLHQHTHLHNIFETIRKNGSGIVDDYLKYQSHVRRQVYAGSEADVAKKVEDAERHWPAYKVTSLLMSRPSYQIATAPNSLTAQEVEAKAWFKAYIHEDVERLQAYKQHHVHPVNDETGEREVLPGCCRKDKPRECKSLFPRDTWLWKSAVVLCKGFLRMFGMPESGRRNMEGAMHGPANHGMLNATHPGLLAAQRHNSDVQLPYRFPITPETCTCGQSCAREQECDDNSIICAAQISQDAQTGYACDYCTKRQAMAFNEMKECCKGHQDLGKNCTVKIERTCKNDTSLVFCLMRMARALCVGKWKT